MSETAIPENHDFGEEAVTAATDILHYLGIGADASKEPYADRRRDKLARIIEAVRLKADQDATERERERCAKIERERDEAVNWSGIVERHGTDQFDDLAEAWLKLDAIQRVTNAVTSTFSKWANDDLMDRFRKHQLAMFHMAFVEGCLAGVKAAEAKASAIRGEGREG